MSLEYQQNGNYSMEELMHVFGLGTKAEDEPVKIRTHDRIAFKRCRRMWDLCSQMRQHLEPIPTEQVNENLWFGSGFHFALEDYHGYNRFGDPTDAFAAYVESFPIEEKPEGWEDLLDLGIGMLDYYSRYWLPRRDEFKTLWIKDVPQVEVEFSIPIPELKEVVGKDVFYQGKLDKVVTDAFGRLWVVDYKTATRYDTSKLETDPQISAYCWAAEQWYQLPVEGMIYIQFVKNFPKPPRVLQNGMLSLDSRQSTTYALYKEALLEYYGLENKFPPKYVEFLNSLVEKETLEGDSFIRWDFVRKNAHQKAAEYRRIISEGYEMLNPNISLYTNPTRDCAWDCAFRSVCLAMDDGSDWRFILSSAFRQQSEGGEKIWRNRIKWPDQR